MVHMLSQPERQKMASFHALPEKSWIFRRSFPTARALRSLLALISAFAILLLSACSLSLPELRVSTPSTEIPLALQSETSSAARSAESRAKPTQAVRTSAPRPKKTERPSESFDLSSEFDCGDLSRAAGKSTPVASIPENAAAFAELSDLLGNFLVQNHLENADISLVYDDYSSGQRYTWQPDLRVTAVSVIKVAMAMLCAQLMEEGVFKENMSIAYIPGDQFQADNMDPARMGEIVPLKTLLASAVIYSDNAATSAVFNYFKRHGRDIKLFMDERFGLHYAEDICMSGREGANLICTLKADVDKYPVYEEILEWMSSSTWGSFLTAGIPVSVAHKYGNLNEANNEIGFVYTDKPFSYAAFTRNVNAYQLLPELGALLYSYNSGLPYTPPIIPTFPDMNLATEPESGESVPLPTYTEPTEVVVFHQQVVVREEGEDRFPSD